MTKVKQFTAEGQNLDTKINDWILTIKNFKLIDVKYSTCPFEVDGYTVIVRSALVIYEDGGE